MSVLDCAAGADEKRYFKYSFTSCEVLCCEVDEIYTALLHSDSLLQKLFSFLKGPKPLNLMRAGYVARVVLCLLMRRTSEMLSFLESHPDIIGRLVDHIDTTSIAEVRSCCDSSRRLLEGGAAQMILHDSVVNQHGSQFLAMSGPKVSAWSSETVKYNGLSV
jgi:hypothetical protein